jgi:7-carboxy-7-deazaguanine synthase
LLDPAKVSEWLCEDGLGVRLQLQMHKYIWPPDERGV